jgi:hypothetical protein
MADFFDDFENEDDTREEITFEDLWEYDNYFDYELESYEFHGTGDTGSKH